MYDFDQLLLPVKGSAFVSNSQQHRHDKVFECCCCQLKVALL
jgi:hypothetical protein